MDGFRRRRSAVRRVHHRADVEVDEEGDVVVIRMRRRDGQVAMNLRGRVTASSLSGDTAAPRGSVAFSNARLHKGAHLTVAAPGAMVAERQEVWSA